MRGDDAGFLVGAGGLEVLVPLQELVAAGHVSGLPAGGCVVGTLLVLCCICNTSVIQTRLHIEQHAIADDLAAEVGGDWFGMRVVRLHRVIARFYEQALTKKKARSP
jgi:hypothetical protein